MQVSISARVPALTCVSASRNRNQSPVAALAPAFLARAIWLMGSKTTWTPALLAISAVPSVELLSTTMISDSKSERALARKADERCCTQLAMPLTSLKAGMMTESFMESLLSFFRMHSDHERPLTRPLATLSPTLGGEGRGEGGWFMANSQCHCIEMLTGTGGNCHGRRRIMEISRHQARVAVSFRQDERQRSNRAHWRIQPRSQGAR